MVLASTRKRLVLRNDQGAELGEIDDDVVTVAKGTHKGLTFRQIELEFGDGQSLTAPTGYVVDAVVKKIRKAGAHIERVQKFAKSIGLDVAPSADPPHLGRRATIADVVRLSIANGYERLLDNDYRLRLAPGDPPPHAVHQARVATRRLRSDLKTFSPFLDPVWLRHTTAELRWLGNRLGQVRDADVLAHRLEGAGNEALQQRLAAQRRDFSAELAEAINGDRYRHLVERLHAGSLSPPLYVDGEARQKSGRTPRPEDPARRGSPRVGRAAVEAGAAAGAQGRAQAERYAAPPHPDRLQATPLCRRGGRAGHREGRPADGEPGQGPADRARRPPRRRGRRGLAPGRRARRHGFSRFRRRPACLHDQRQQRQLRRRWRSEWDALATPKSTRWLR